MYLSPEVVTTIVGTIALHIAWWSGCFVVVRRMDRMGEELGGRMDRMGDDLVEVKIAIARVEGPPRHLITGR